MPRFYGIRTGDPDADGRASAAAQAAAVFDEHRLHRLRTAQQQQHHDPFGSSLSLADVDENGK